MSHQQLEFCIPTRTIALGWRNKKGQLKYALLVVIDLHFSLADLSRLYNFRGAAGIDIPNDKQGFLLTHYRKRHCLSAQEILVLLNDWVHNLLIFLRNTIFLDTPLARFGPYRLIHDGFNILVQVILSHDWLIELHLLKSHPFSDTLTDTLHLWNAPL